MQEHLTNPDPTERGAFMAYVFAIGESVGHDASAEQARQACPAEFAAWREAFVSEYGYDPAVPRDAGADQ